MVPCTTLRLSFPFCAESLPLIGRNQTTIGPEIPEQPQLAKTVESGQTSWWLRFRTAVVRTYVRPYICTTWLLPIMTAWHRPYLELDFT